jgi:hypothetical protein
MTHFFLAVGFAILGIYTTVVTWGAYTKLGKDLYGVDALGPHNTQALNGTIITVDPTNVALCPAFLSCADQATWFNAAHVRATLSVLGCLLFDSVL